MTCVFWCFLKHAIFPLKLRLERIVTTFFKKGFLLVLRVFDGLVFGYRLAALVRSRFDSAFKPNFSGYGDVV